MTHYLLPHALETGVFWWAPSVQAGAPQFTLHNASTGTPECLPGLLETLYLCCHSRDFALEWPPEAGLCLHPQPHYVSPTGPSKVMFPRVAWHLKSHVYF